ncbi:hypothetical protein Q0590_14410 [Rhodocytophaga aerolata]|uniref:Outer membrane beta-barrel protein n=1 Tax=Rhodocytophaga aerolata TaxID=455078 RepID=A0ABT8R5V0_9BACT|nr:hypothetical protein [Rhodocytophaga aerolata]MDO1447457.1 hypothetical protein [Rhodocytophaga aerolata]
MSTQDIPDNELDDFFRKSLEEPEIDFREEDWLQLEKKMDAAARQKATFRKYLYSVLLLLLLGISIPTALWINSQDDATAIASLPEQALPESSTSTEGTPKRTDSNTVDEFTDNQLAANNPDETNNKNTADLKQLEEPKGKQTKAVEEKEESQGKELPKQAVSRQDSKEKDKETKLIGKEGKETGVSGEYKPTATVGTAKQPAQQNNKPADLSNEEIIGTEPSIDRKINPSTSRRVRQANENTDTSAPKIIPGNSMTYIHGKPSTSKPSVESKEDVTDANANEWDQPGTPLIEPTDEYTNGVGGLPSEWPLFSMSQVAVKQLTINRQFPGKYTRALTEMLPASSADTQPNDSIVKKLAKERINYRFKISLVLSPDISTVRLGDITRPGTNIGILFSYRFSPRMSVSTGLIRSAKIYDARTEDYNPPYGQWIYYIKPVAIKATCTVLDIPLNIRYNLLAKEKFTLYAVTGLSSYLMLSEYYKYIYNVDDTHLRKYWKVNNENKHFFKVYNISAGYERKLGRRLTAGAEPFVKIPGAGVGFGKIQLWSAGIFISANYQLGK